MMKIAIAGTNGLAQFIAYYLSQITSHSFIFLSTATNPGLKERDWQVLVVPYDNQSSLSYILRGVDVVISTISGEAQLALVDAAATAQVRHFIPSGFSGPQQCAPQMVAASTNEWQSLISRLEHHQLESSMRYTIFTCGIFYEQFCPGGLNAMQISTITSQNAGIGEEGAFLVDLRAGKAMIPVTPGSQQEAVICMTSARDTARYLVAAMQTYKDMTIWPNEFKFCTERMTVSELLNTCSRVRGAPIPPTFVTPQHLQKTINQAQSASNGRLRSNMSQLLACAEGAFDFSPTDINLPATVLAIARTEEPAEHFEEWLGSVWTSPPSADTSATASASLGVPSHETSRSSSAKSGTKSR
ncbi:hypothetical protein H2198_002759 [Neophaeococcomyces mojaviensis]|uniref:Uncharacterized protein n=1 Tax=Neophaeococcomyces mojaviensis TaxID=3383035 RepID=A0ACC3ADS8_9EURO|nr:hypothetical protein H2198_002759 [Knufia sp. JES_112]